MSNASIRRDIKSRLETRDSYQQAAIEGAVLRGELGPDRQLIALSERYKELYAAGQLLEARAIKYQAIVIRAANPQA